ncbi:MAG TPA: sulfite exporter TauE/SafE family protein [Stellaceae bacterium]|nr:sulfite exporter TauE/SafE family protein [Stellaceae bacterium]
MIASTENIGRTSPAAFGGGAIIGAIGGLIGLGGAEFRLPLLIGAFRFAALQAVILNKAMSLVVVALALPFRAAAVPLASVGAHWPIIVNLLAGSLVGAWFGASWAIRLASHTLYRVIAVLLFGIAVVLVIGHDAGPAASAMLDGPAHDRRRCRWVWDRNCRSAARRRRRRAADPDARAAVRCGYQARRQLVARG